MKLIFPAIVVAVLSALAFYGPQFGLEAVFGIWIPRLAFLIFVIGFIVKIIGWARTPVPFNITTTSGQQKSLPWIKANNLENPYNIFGVIGRMALEVFAFRSLFRNNQVKFSDGKLTYSSYKWLWAAGLAFHWAFFIVFIRHFRFFLHPLPEFLIVLEQFDHLFQIGVPAVYLTDVLLLAGITFLFFRRVAEPQMRYLSQAADFFPLFLIIAIAVTGIMMRYVVHVDIMLIKSLTMGLATELFPAVPAGLPPGFYIHLFLVSVLFAYFPFSKLMHMGGVFMSPTRNMKGNSRMFRHINPWDYEVKPHSYAAYEDDFREKMKDAGLPVEKE
ncbi:MAG: sulfate reduction electron transfer complex DsrMKJOP subunit DsrM [Spirochaetia bacterium]|nr:sulfate reduction electron transfer complex DsrMKJOP subunit DsrM [Spirochaetia bacterium]